MFNNAGGPGSGKNRGARVSARGFRNPGSRRGPRNPRSQCEPQNPVSWRGPRRGDAAGAGGVEAPLDPGQATLGGRPGARREVEVRRQSPPSSRQRPRRLHSAPTSPSETARDPATRAVSGAWGAPWCRPAGPAVGPSQRGSPFLGPCLCARRGFGPPVSWG